MEDRNYCRKMLKCHFTDEQKSAMGQEISQKVAEKKMLEDDKKASASSFKSRIDTVQSSINTLAGNLNSGWEMRSVKCEIVKDYQERKVLYVRTDTGEVAEEKEMSADDQQMTLDERNKPEPEVSCQKCEWSGSIADLMEDQLCPECEAIIALPEETIVNESDSTVGELMCDACGWKGTQDELVNEVECPECGVPVDGNEDVTTDGEDSDSGKSETEIAI